MATENKKTHSPAPPPPIRVEISDFPTPLYEEEKRDLEYQEQKARINSLSQDISERKKYAQRVFILICGWVVWMFVGLLFQAVNFRGFYLSDTVIIAFIVSTTANIIGLFALVMNYLFRQNRAP